MTELILKHFSLWELLLMATFTGLFFGGMLGIFIERANWQSDCLLEKIRHGKYVDFVCSWKPKHAPNPKTTMEHLEERLENLRTAEHGPRSMETH